MQVKFKATGRLKKYLDTATIDSGTLDLGDNCTIAELLRRLKIPDDEPFALIVNNTMVPQSELASTGLQDKDEITLIPPIRGG